MGMHFGMLALACPREAALTELRRYAGEFYDVESLGRSFPAFPGLDWTRVEIDEHHGRTIVTDSTCELTGLRPDLMISLSGSVPETVVASYAETTSRSFGLVVARGGQLLRLYQSCQAAWSKPFTLGEPLPFEASSDLEGLDGGATAAALRHFGFVDPGRDDFGEAKRYWCRLNRVTGPLQELIVDHGAKCAIPPDAKPGLTVVSRIVDPAPPSPGFRSQRRKGDRT